MAVRRASTRERGLEGLCTLLGPVYNFEEAYERCGGPLGYDLLLPRML